MAKYYDHIWVEQLEAGEAAEYLGVAPEVLHRYGKTGPELPFFLRFDRHGVQGPLYFKRDLDLYGEKLELAALKD